jgi:hypothetical protein
MPQGRPHRGRRRLSCGSRHCSGYPRPRAPRRRRSQRRHTMGQLLELPPRFIRQGRLGERPHRLRGMISRRATEWSKSPRNCRAKSPSEATVRATARLQQYSPYFLGHGRHPSWLLYFYVVASSLRHIISPRKSIATLDFRCSLAPNPLTSRRRCSMFDASMLMVEIGRVFDWYCVL